jgi:hypothetical protein
MIRLESLFSIGIGLTKLRLPILYPILKRQLRISRRSKEMKVIGHENIPSDKPSGCFGPYRPKNRVVLVRGEPRAATFRANGQEDNG